MLNILPNYRVSKCAVIIVNYNSGHHLSAALEGLSRQTRAPDRVVVIDNASDDSSAIDAQEQYPGYLFLFLETNTGFAAANNGAISDLAGFEYVALLNPDAVPDKDWLGKLLDDAVEFPMCGSFASRMLCADDLSLLDGAGDIYHISGLPWRRFYRQKLEKNSNAAAVVFGSCAGAALYKIDAIELVGLFDEDFFCYVEDVDLGFRLQLAGYGCRYVPDAVVTHVGSATTGLNSPFSIYYGHRNLVWSYVKNMPGILFYLFLPLHILLNVSSIAFFGLRGDMGPICRAKWDAIKGLPLMWRKRRDIQKRRSASVLDILKLMDKRLIKLPSGFSRKNKQ